MKTAQNIPIGSRRTISPNEVILLTADINYTRVYFLNGAKMTVATPLKELEKRFAQCTEFFRTHKSFLVNINYIKNYDSDGNESYVQMKNDYRVTVSRRKKRAFIERILTISQNI